MKTVIELTPTDISVAVQMFLEKYHNSKLNLENFDFEYLPDGETPFPFNRTSLILTDKYPDPQVG